MTGSGHSFTAAAVTDGVLLRPGGLTRIRSVDQAAGLVTVEAGCPLRVLNAELLSHDLAYAAPHQEYFRDLESLLTAAAGRPHWGKLHTRDAGYLAAAYPRFADFTALRDRMDPQRRFGNAYLTAVLGA